jgi:chemotaxis protein methyltransferase CheR
MGNLDEAARCIDRVTSKPQRASLRLRFVRSLLARAEVARARQMLDLCLKEEPLLLEAQLLKAGFAEESGDLPVAEQAYRRALYINPNAPMAHFHLALLLERKGDRPGVARSLKTTLKLIQGKDPHALVEFGEGVCHGRLKEMVSMLMAK